MPNFVESLRYVKEDTPNLKIIGCTSWQSTPQNLLNINLPNLWGWLQVIPKEGAKIILKLILS